MLMLVFLNPDGDVKSCQQHPRQPHPAEVQADHRQRKRDGRSKVGPRAQKFNAKKCSVSPLGEALRGICLGCCEAAAHRFQK